MWCIKSEVKGQPHPQPLSKGRGEWYVLPITSGNFPPLYYEVALTFKVSIQGCKKRKTTNAIYVTDSQGIPQNYMACPVSANYGRLLKSFFYLIYVVLVDGR